MRAKKASLEVVNGGTLALTKGLSFGSTNFNAEAGRVTVGNGAELLTGSNNNVEFFSNDGELVISNATVRIGTIGYPKMYVGGEDGSAVQGTNFWVVFKGESPSLTTADGAKLQTYFRKGCGIRFDVPPEGYAAVPMDRVFQFFAPDDFRIEIAGLEECCRTIRSRKTMTLIATTYEKALESLVDNPGILERLRSSLPEGCSCFIETVDERQYLRLKVKPLYCGMKLIVR